MPDPFATALGVLHGAPGSVEAVYTPAGGDPIPDVRLIRNAGSREAQLGETVLRMDADTWSVQRSDVERPAEGDRIEIGDAAYLVSSAPLLDDEGVSWSFEAAEVPA